MRTNFSRKTINTYLHIVVQWKEATKQKSLSLPFKSYGGFFFFFFLDLLEFKNLSELE